MRRDHTLFVLVTEIRGVILGASAVGRRVPNATAILELADHARLELLPSLPEALPTAVPVTEALVSIVAMDLEWLRYSASTRRVRGLAADAVLAIGGRG